MNKMIPASLSVAFLIACGGAGTKDPMTTPPADPVTPPADPATPPAELDCDKEPAAMQAASPAAGDAFSVTGERIEASTSRTFGFGSVLAISRSEGGNRDVTLHALNDCGLWLSEVYVGTELGGDPDVRKTTYRRIEKAATEPGGVGAAAAFVVEALGAKLRIVANDDGTFIATLTEAIELYDGE